MTSFITEVESLKPGNVHVYSGGHGMVADDFIKSAEVSTPILCESNQSLGWRIYEAVKATHFAVNCNTNLGMILLFTPLIMAYEISKSVKLRENLTTVLESITKDDTKLVFKAISLANPGGLGKVNKYDVNSDRECALLEAMSFASHRDNIALQYTNSFNEIFNIGFINIKSFVKRWNSVKWGTVACYLNFVSTLLDSHIQRKHGNDIAEQIRVRSKYIADRFNNSTYPKLPIILLKDFDKELKSKNINPGTSADLTAASILLYKLLCR